MQNAEIRKVYYVDNKQFLAELIAYGKELRAAKRKKLPKPSVSEYIGTCIIKIAHHFAYKPQYCRYPFLDEMISDAVENCLIYVHNFDPKKSSNPFAYFTQITYHAFIRRILREKRHLDIKNRYIASLDLDTVILQAQDDGEYNNTFIQFLKEQVDQATSEMNALPPKKLPKKKKTTRKRKTT
jgi:hypothetical protein